VQVNASHAAGEAGDGVGEALREAEPLFLGSARLEECADVSVNHPL
jgi:hypothetical protein